jgi:hypothetical protein
MDTIIVTDSQKTGRKSNTRYTKLRLDRGRHNNIKSLKPSLEDNENHRLLSSKRETQ